MHEKSSSNLQQLKTSTAWTKGAPVSNTSSLSNANYRVFLTATTQQRRHIRDSMSPLEYVVSSYLKTAKVDLELFAVGIKERRLQTLWSPVLGA